HGKLLMDEGRLQEDGFGGGIKPHEEIVAFLLRRGWKVLLSVGDPVSAGETAFERQGDAARTVALVLTLPDDLALVAGSGAVRARGWRCLIEVAGQRAEGEVDLGNVWESGLAGKVLKGVEAEVIVEGVLEGQVHAHVGIIP